VIRSSAVGLGFVALVGCVSLASAQTFSPGEQCRPAAADPSQVRDCRVHAVGTRQICRCVVLPGVNEAARLSTTRPTAGPVSSGNGEDG
jgi:hypothetical protein